LSKTFSSYLFGVSVCPGDAEGDLASPIVTADDDDAASVAMSG
jgi:hypothetical protein